LKTITKTKKYLVLVLVCVMLVAMAICPASANKSSGVVPPETTVGKEDYSYIEIPSEYESIVKTDTLELMADKTSGLFCVKNLKNGYTWLSIPSGLEYDTLTGGSTKKQAQSLLVVEYVNADAEVSSAYKEYCYSVDAYETSVVDIENGFRIDYKFEIDLSASADETEEEAVELTEPQFVYLSASLEIAIIDGALKATIDMDKIKADEKLLVTSCKLLPYFGAGRWTDDGYIFVPDGSGALINFKGHDNSNDTYNQMVYGNDLSIQTALHITETETIRMPVFGLKNGNNAFCAVISEGAESSYISANPTIVGCGYNRVGAEVALKLLSKTVMFGKSSNKQEIYRLSKGNGNIDKFSVNYYFLDNEDATYVGMARTYSEYLTKNNLINSTVSKPVLNVDTYGAIDITGNFLGFDYKELEPLTTADQLIEMTEELKSKGISDLGIRYIGWDNNGVTNSNPLKNVNYISEIGGKKGFSKLVEYLNDKSIPFTTASDLITFTEGKRKIASKDAFSEIYYKYQYLRSVYSFDLEGNKQMLLLPNLVEEYGKKYIDSYLKNVPVSSISLPSLTNGLYSNLRVKDAIFRATTLDHIEKVLANATESGLAVSGESANAYSFRYLNKIYKTPVYSSAYSLLDEEVPFYQIALHGKIAMTGDAMVQTIDSDTMFLKCVESGIELLWNGIYTDSAILADTNYDDLYGSTYTLWIDNAAKRYSSYQDLLKKIYDQEIVSHGEIYNDVTVTEYENGVKVYVNYTEKDVKVGDITVEKRSFATNNKEG